MHAAQFDQSTFNSRPDNTPNSILQTHYLLQDMAALGVNNKQTAIPSQSALPLRHDNMSNLSLLTIFCSYMYGQLFLLTRYYKQTNSLHSTDPNFPAKPLMILSHQYPEHIPIITFRKPTVKSMKLVKCLESCLIAIIMQIINITDKSLWLWLRPPNHPEQ